MKLFGPPCEQVGGRWGDFWRDYRDQRAHDFLVKVDSLTTQEKIQVKRVSLKLLPAIFDEASLEDNDDLQQIWANLLTNAADARQTSPVAASFPEILKHLSQREVTFLDALYDDAIARNPLKGERNTSRAAVVTKYQEMELMGIYSAAGLSRVENLMIQTHGDWEKRPDDMRADMRDFRRMLAIVRKEGILESSEKVSVQQQYGRPPYQSMTPDLATKITFSFSELGAAFVEACRKPKTENN